MTYFKLEDFDFKGKRVLVRFDFNVPLDEAGNVVDDYRIRIALPTFKYLLDHGAKQLIVVVHAGRPKNCEPIFRTNKIAECAGKLLGVKVGKVDDWGESGLPEDRIVFLENIRFHPGEKSKDENELMALAKQLASLADLYVDDAFANLHRAHASMTGVPKFIPGCIGLRVEEELRLIQNALSKPKKPVVAVIGGLKADKLVAIHNLLDNVDKILVAGALAFTLLKSKGLEMGASKIDAEGLDSLKDLADKIMLSDKVALPTDAVIADSFSADADSKVVPVNGVLKDWMALDLGPFTIKSYCDELKKANTILWFGPIGVFEFDKFAEGTKAIAEVIAESKAVTIVGGGDSGGAVTKLGLFDKMTLVASGGGASLMLIEGKPLPAITALEENYSKFKDKI